MTLCKNFGKKVRSLLKKVDNELERLGPIVLKVTTGIKNLLSSPAVDILTVIIPGDLDGRIRDMIVKKLDEAIDYLNIIDTCRGKTGAAKVQCFIDELKKKSKPVQRSLLIKLASILTGMLHTGSLSQNEYDTFIQLQYSLQKKS